MVNNEKYDNDAAFFSIVNNKALETKLSEKTERMIAENFSDIERAVQNSIGCVDRKIEFQAQTEEKGRKIEQRIKKTMIALRITAALLIPTTIIGGLTAAKWLETQSKINSATNIAIENTKQELLAYGYAELNYDKANLLNEGPFTIKNNSVEDYKRINVNSIEDVYIYRQVLPENEFEELIRSMQYTTPDGTFYYVSFEQYLSVNGFTGVKNFENTVENIFLKKIEQGELVIAYNDAGTINNGKRGAL